MREDAMTTLQETGNQLVLSSGSPLISETTLTLDRSNEVARIYRVALLVFRRTEAVPFKEIRELSLKPETDGASGAERYLPVLRLADGSTLALPPIDEREEAEDAAKRIRKFVGLKH
jgi:hypothetical protein